MEKASVAVVVTFLAACAPSAPPVAPGESMPALAPAAPSAAPNVGPVAAHAGPAPSGAASGGVTPAPPQSDLIPGWEISGTDRKSYRLARDTATTTSGKASARLEWIGGDRKFGYLAQQASAERYRGKRVRFSASVRGEGLTDWASIWFRVDGGTQKWNYKDLRRQPIRGTTGWSRQEIVLDVEPTSNGIAFGLTLWGKGRAWIDDAKVDVVPGALTPPSPRGLVNGDFEAAGDGVVGWSMSGGGSGDYTPSIDHTVKHGGASSARLSSRNATPSGYGTLATDLDAVPWRGKRVRMLGFVKGEGIGGRGDFWLRVQAADSPGDGPGLGGGSCRLHATFDFKRCEMVFDVSKAGESIELGIGLDGPGTIWLDDVKLEAVGKNVPLNNGLDPATNLDFEE